MRKTDTSIRSVLSEIEKSTSYRFLYNEEVVDADKIVSVNVKDESVDDVLKTLFKNDKVDYKIVDNQIILSASSTTQQTTQQDGRTVTGVITDASGAGLPSVSVIVKGTTKATVTDLDGNYSLEVPNGATLTFRYIGYISQDIKVGGQSKIDVLLKEDTQALEEVVVVGYTTQRKADLTGSVSSVKMDNINDMAITDISSALQGRMSGVTILQNSGAPGSGTSIRVRGMGTFGNADPLYVIDGVPSDNMNDINPSDIERVDVLKDASSSAIYGSRAANGVVLIQTKKGKRDSGKVNVAFNTYQGISATSKKLDLLNAQQRNTIHLEAYGNALADGKISKKDYDKATAYYNSDYAKVDRTNWQDEIFSGEAYRSNYDLSLSGGTKTATYNVMLAHLNQNGTLKETGYNRTTLRVNTELEPIKNLKFGENLTLSHSKQKIVADMSASGAIISALRADPSVPVYDENGAFSGSGVLSPDIQNPVGIIDRADRKRSRDRIFGNVYAQYTFLDDFTIKTDFGYDWVDWGDKWFTSRVPEAGRASNTNELTQEDHKTVRWTNTTSIKYDKQIDQHKIMVFAGHSYESYKDDWTSARGTGFISEDKSQRYLSAATKIAWLQGLRDETALDSWMGRVDYSFADRYLLSANFRTDGSSKFAKGNRWGYFPSVSAGWRISEEAFFTEAKSYIQNLKLRASWGKIGNELMAFAPSPYYPTYTLIANTTDDDGYNVVFGKGETVGIGRYESTLANPDLKWETTTQTDIGLDVSFLDKFTFEFDYYNKESKDVLVSVPVPSLAGVPNLTKVINAAEVRNRGFDVSLGYTTRINDLDIHAYGNLSSVNNKVLAVNTFYPSSYRGTTITRTSVGEPISHFYGYKTDGIFRTQEEIDNYVNKDGKKIQPNAKPGDIKFLDLNGDGVISASGDKTKIGSGFPKVTYGLGLDLAYKGFDLNLFFQGVGKSEIFNAMRYEGMFVDPRYNQYAEIMNRFHPVNNPNGNLPRVTTSDTNGNINMSDYFVESGSYLRMKTLTLGYTFNRNIINKLRLQKLRAYATIENLFTITHYSGFDPDLGNAYGNELGSNVNEIGVDRGQFPQPRTFILGVNINF